MGSCFLPWRSLCLVLFLFLQSMFHLSSGCFVEEKAALEDIQSSLIRVGTGKIDSWGEDSENCCSWDGVKCNNSTHRVTHLDLSNVCSIDREVDNWYLNSSAFSVFHELEYLDLSENLCLQSLEGFVGLAKLRYLNLSHNGWGGGFPELIREIVSLEILDLNRNQMTGGLPSAAFQNLRNLRQLHMAQNGFDGNLPASVFVLPRLKLLDFSGNKFIGKIPVSGPNKLEVLDLSFNYLNGTLPVTGIAEFKSIKNLNLAGNQFTGSLPVSLFALLRLKFLDLSRNNFNGLFPMSLSLKPVSLEVLYLDANNMSGALPTERAFENLQNLRELSLSSNQFSGNIPAVLFSLPHIERLNLSTNFFEGPIPISPSSNISLSLKSLRFSHNNLSGRISFISLQNLTKLEEIDLSGNANLVVHVNIPGWIPQFQLKHLLLSGCDLDKSIIAYPHFLRTQHHLEVLDLSCNNLSGSMPNWLFTEEAKLNHLNLGNNSLTGSLDPVQHVQSFLCIIDIQMNNVAGQLPANISSIFPNLCVLDISSNNFFGNIPPSLCRMDFLYSLDLSNNKLSGEFPACMFRFEGVTTILKVSNNKLSGQIFGGMTGTISMSDLSELHMDGNKFEGTVTAALMGPTLLVIDLHGNKLSGELDTSAWYLPSLVVLNLAGNRLTGKIHPMFCGLETLQVLDISSNNLRGSLPYCNFTQLHFLNLSRNSLSSDISFLPFNASRLLALDIRHNNFSGNLHWIRNVNNIRLLFLGGNKFEGQITTNICNLLYLRILDLSRNKLSGSLPACIANISFRGETYDQIFQSIYKMTIFGFIDEGDCKHWSGVLPRFCDNSSLYDLVGFSFATKGNLYTYGRGFFILMAGIDLSTNMLDGEIPWELGNLSHIKSLNLSNNHFVGPIPATFGGMEEIESLDLSHNKLCGPIPSQLNQLSFLGVFSVAYNNLSGCIPNSGQLGSFSMDSYLANTNLHKITQSNMCTPDPDPVPEEDVGETHGDPVVYAITAAAFVLAFWATIGFSFCHPYGRSVMLKL